MVVDCRVSVKRNPHFLSFPQGICFCVPPTLRHLDRSAAHSRRDSTSSPLNNPSSRPKRSAVQRPLYLLLLFGLSSRRDLHLPLPLLVLSWHSRFRHHPPPASVPQLLSFLRDSASSPLNNPSSRPKRSAVERPLYLLLACHPAGICIRLCRCLFLRWHSRSHHRRLSHNFFHSRRDLASSHLNNPSSRPKRSAVERPLYLLLLFGLSSRRDLHLPLPLLVLSCLFLVGCPIHDSLIVPGGTTLSQPLLLLLSTNPSTPEKPYPVNCVCNFQKRS
jgi:hypothetical protein